MPRKPAPPLAPLLITLAALVFSVHTIAFDVLAPVQAYLLGAVAPPPPPITISPSTAPLPAPGGTLTTQVPTPVLPIGPSPFLSIPLPLPTNPVSPTPNLPTSCRNFIVESGEECDAGLAGGPCCYSNCRAKAAGTVCTVSPTQNGLCNALHFCEIAHVAPAPLPTGPLCGSTTCPPGTTCVNSTNGAPPTCAADPLLPPPTCGGPGQYCCPTSPLPTCNNVNGQPVACVNGKCPPPPCGDGKCDPLYENSFSCPSDCGGGTIGGGTVGGTIGGPPPPPPPPTCVNGQACVTATNQPGACTAGVCVPTPTGCVNNNPPCPAGLTCSNNVCISQQTCGGPGFPCCANQTCNSPLSLTCRSAVPNGPLLCLPPCGSAGQYCCLPPTPSCNGNLTCSAGRCMHGAPSCGPNNPCPPGLTCNAGICTPQTCTPDGSYCTGGRPCCTAGNVCNFSTTFRCMPPSTCGPTNPCPTGQTCTNGACVPTPSCQPGFYCGSTWVAPAYSDDNDEPARTAALSALASCPVAQQKYLQGPSCTPTSCSDGINTFSSDDNQPMDPADSNKATFGSRFDYTHPNCYVCSECATHNVLATPPRPINQYVAFNPRNKEDTPCTAGSQGPPLSFIGSILSAFNLFAHHSGVPCGGTSCNNDGECASNEKCVPLPIRAGFPPPNPSGRCATRHCTTDADCPQNLEPHRCTNLSGNPMGGICLKGAAPKTCRRDNLATPNVNEGDVDCTPQVERCTGNFAGPGTCVADARCRMDNPATINVNEGDPGCGPGKVCYGNASGPGLCRFKAFRLVKMPNTAPVCTTDTKYTTDPWSQFVSGQPFESNDPQLTANQNYMKNLKDCIVASIRPVTCCEVGATPHCRENRPDTLNVPFRIAAAIVRRSDLPETNPDYRAPMGHATDIYAKPNPCSNVPSTIPYSKFIYERNTSTFALAADIPKIECSVPGNNVTAENASCAGALRMVYPGATNPPPNDSDKYADPICANMPIRLVSRHVTNDGVHIPGYLAPPYHARVESNGWITGSEIRGGNIAFNGTFNRTELTACKNTLAGYVTRNNDGTYSPVGQCKQEGEACNEFPCCYKTNFQLFGHPIFGRFRCKDNACVP